MALLGPTRKRRDAAGIRTDARAVAFADEAGALVAATRKNGRREGKPAR